MMRTFTRRPSALPFLLLPLLLLTAVGCGGGGSAVVDGDGTGVAPDDGPSLEDVCRNYVAQPVITSVEPASGPRGTRVKIKGSGFRRCTGGRTPLVSIGDRQVDSDYTTAYQDTEIIVTAPGQPAGSSLGEALPIRVVVTHTLTNQQASSAPSDAARFTYTAAP